jgi:mannan endo-1,6-alpha-mannosidase
MNRTEALLSTFNATFVSNNILTETACETHSTCDVDEKFYKGIGARDLARTAQVAPFTASIITPLLQSSAKGAATIGCDSEGDKCVLDWSQTSSDASDVGSQFSALQIIQQNLVASSKAPSAGGSATSNSSASGTASSSSGGSTATGGTASNEAGMASASNMGLTALVSILALVFFF